MLWRAGYEPRVFEGVDAPGLPDGLCVGIFDPRGQAELGIWLRLLQSVELDSKAHIVAVSIGDRRKVEAVLPPSRQAQLVWLDEPESALSVLVSPDRPERAFAAIVRGGIARLLVVGAPTEDVWERFQEAAGETRAFRPSPD